MTAPSKVHRFDPVSLHGELGILPSDEVWRKTEEY